MWGSADGVTLHNSWCLRSDWFSKTKAWRLLNTVQFAWMHLRESSHDKDQRLVFAYRYLNSIVFEKNLKIRTLFIKIPSTKMKQCYGKILHLCWNVRCVQYWCIIIISSRLCALRQLPYFRILGSQECMCMRLLVRSFYFHVCHRSMEILGILDEYASFHDAVLRWTAFLMPELL